MNKLDKLMAEYSIIRDKILLFSAGLGGSFLTFFKINNLIGDSILVITFLVSLYGLLFNLYKAGKIQKEIRELKADDENI